MGGRGGVSVLLTTRPRPAPVYLSGRVKKSAHEVRISACIPVMQSLCLLPERICFIIFPRNTPSPGPTHPAGTPPRVWASLLGPQKSPSSSNCALKTHPSPIEEPGVWGEGVFWVSGAGAADPGASPPSDPARPVRGLRVAPGEEGTAGLGPASAWTLQPQAEGRPRVALRPRHRPQRASLRAPPSVLGPGPGSVTLQQAPEDYPRSLEPSGWDERQGCALRKPDSPSHLPDGVCSLTLITRQVHAPSSSISERGHDTQESVPRSPRVAGAGGWPSRRPTRGPHITSRP